MKKIYLFLAAIFASLTLSAQTVTLNCGEISGFDSWKSSYDAHIVDTLGCIFNFDGASNQDDNQPINDIPVFKGSKSGISNTLSIVLKDATKQITAINLKARQWISNKQDGTTNPKPQTITLNTSFDGVNFSATTVTSDTFSISSNTLPTNTVGVKFSFDPKKDQIGIESITITIADKEAVAVENPAFSVKSGLKTEAFDLEITCPTADAKIYYTLDGTEPSEASTLYSAKIKIEETTTVKAIAIKGEDKSNIITATYTFPESVENIAAFIEKADKTNSIMIKNPVYVTFQNGSNLYVQDESGAIVIYGSGLPKFSNGDRLTVMGKYDLYNDLHEIINATIIEQEAGDSIEPTLTEIADITVEAQSRFVKIAPATITEDANFETSSAINANITNGTDTVVIRNNYKNFEASFAKDDQIEVIGIVTIYKGEAQIYAISVAPYKENQGGNAVDNLLSTSAVYVSNGTLFIETVEGADVKVFDINGRTLNAQTATESLTAIENLPQGVVIVTVDGKIGKAVIR